MKVFWPVEIIVIDDEIYYNYKGILYTNKEELINDKN